LSNGGCAVTVDVPESDPDAVVVASLTEIGLTPNQSRAYMALLRGGPATASEVALRAGVPRPKIYDVLQSLERYGLCSTSGGGRVTRWTPIPGDLALPDFVRQREQERRAQAKREQTLATELAKTLPKPEHTPPSPDQPPIQALIGPPRIAEAFENLVKTAQRSLDIVQAQPMVQPPERWNGLEVEALERGVQVRCLYTPEAARDPSRYEPLVAAGGEGRLSDRPVLKLAIRDGTDALVALRDPSFTGSGNDGVTAIMIHQPDLVAPLQTLFRREWRRGTPLATE